MPALSPENVLLSLIVVAPGFIAVYTAIIIGGLEESLSDGRLLGASIAAAFIIDPLFFWGYTLFGGEITDPTAAVRLIVFRRRIQARASSHTRTSLCSSRSRRCRGRQWRFRVCRSRKTSTTV